MPVYTVELTYIQCVSVEAADHEDAVRRVLDDEELPYPTHDCVNVTGVEEVG